MIVIVRIIYYTDRSWNNIHYCVKLSANRDVSNKSGTWAADSTTASASAPRVSASHTPVKTPTLHAPALLWGVRDMFYVYYICVFMSVCVSICESCVCAYVCAYNPPRIGVYVHMCICACVYMCMCAYVLGCVHAREYLYICMYACVRVGCE